MRISVWTTLATAALAATSLQVVPGTAEGRNTGGTTGRFLLRAPSSLARGAVEVSYVFRGRTYTRAISRHGWRTPALAPGERLRLEVGVNARQPDPLMSAMRVTASSAAGRDRVRLAVRIRPRV